MALGQAVPQPQAEGLQQRLVLHLDLLHNWSDLVVLGFSIVFTAYMAIGELLARGWSKGPGAFDHISVFAPLAVGLCVMAWRRFRRVSLMVDEEQVEAISIWGVHKQCRLDELSEVALEGKSLARELHFNQGSKVVFKVLRNVWTRMQLSTLSVFLGAQVPGQHEPLPSRLAAWTASLFIRSLDALFLVVGSAVLAGAVTADLDARAYQRASAICVVSSASTEGSCYGFVPVTVAAIGERSFGQYSLVLRSYTQTYDTTAISNDATYRMLRVGVTTYAKLWRGSLTLIEAGETNWVETKDNPLYQEGWARTGFPTWLVALVGLIPILSRLHPVVT
jgi:hypothetical protein